MNVAIFSPYATVAPHFETELEIAQTHLDQGDSVEIVSCYGKLANCDFNLERDAQRCEDCIGRRRAGISLLEPGIRALELMPIDTDFSPPTFDEISELKTYFIDNFDLGYAALSSLVSVCRNPEPDLQHWGPLLHRLMQSAWTTYQATLEYLRRAQPDRVYLFNGRFASMRAVLRACQSLNTDCFIHERGCDLQHYDLFPNHLPHDIEGIHKIMLELWQRGESDRESIGASWFEDRVNRVEKNWHSFVKDQEAGRLPTNWNNSRHNVSIFCSSDDEFVAIGDHWKNAMYPNQVEGISRVVTDMLTRSPETHIYLRIHPNLKDVDNQRKREMLAIESPNLSIIPPDETIDTYQLLRQSDKIITFGSSVGIEAVYWGIPSILLGPSFYREVGGAYTPADHLAAIELLCQDLKPAEPTGALIYGYWQQTRGIPYQYFEAAGLFEGKFKGQVIHAGMKKREPRFFKRVLRKLKSKRNIC